MVSMAQREVAQRSSAMRESSWRVWKVMAKIRHDWSVTFPERRLSHTHPYPIQSQLMLFTSMLIRLGPPCLVEKPTVLAPQVDSAKPSPTSFTSP